jgi:hypothetical protein
MNYMSLQRGAGKGRNHFHIKEWLAGIGLIPQRVAEMSGKNHGVVGDTMRGLRNDKAVLQCLEGLGCPKDLLYPKNPMLKQRKAA